MIQKRGYMRITEKQLINLIKEVIKEESQADRAREGMRSALNDPRTRIDRGLWADAYATASREDNQTSRPSSTPSKPASSSASTSKAPDLNNPMIANLFTPDELEQLQQKLSAGGERAAQAADTVKDTLTSAAQQLTGLARRFGLMAEQVTSLSGLGVGSDGSYPVTIVTARPVTPEQISMFNNALNNAAAALGLRGVLGLNGTGTNFTARISGLTAAARARGVDMGRPGASDRFARELFNNLKLNFNSQASGIQIRSIARAS